MQGRPKLRGATFRTAPINKTDKPDEKKGLGITGDKKNAAGWAKIDMAPKN